MCVFAKMLFIGTDERAHQPLYYDFGEVANQGTWCAVMVRRLHSLISVRFMIFYFTHARTHTHTHTHSCIGFALYISSRRCVSRVGLSRTHLFDGDPGINKPCPIRRMRFFFLNFLCGLFFFLGHFVVVFFLMHFKYSDI